MAPKNLSLQNDNLTTTSEKTWRSRTPSQRQLPKKLVIWE